MQSAIAAAGPDQDNVIDVRGLWSRFGHTVVHRGIDLSVRRGEVLGVVGGSGSGKTTLLRQMLGLERPYRGSVRVFGIDLDACSGAQLESVRGRWGVLFQNGALFSALNVYDNIALALRELRTLDEDVIRDLVISKLQMVGIEAQHAAKMPAQLSGGMIKRIGLARALALDPELLFLDEPTAGLDPDRSESFVALIEELRREMRLSVVMVTHDLDTLVSLADRVAVLCEQRLLAVGPLREITALDHPFVCNFFQGERGRRALEVLEDVQRLMPI
ncbi:MAG: ATP-binding cassette domain-containing protein [Betaproteobacteria bacterium]|nr:ATP-binding cassette domain-containing protein [Betaproteobacteria bacterium]